MKEITLVIGGTRSGKSRFALKLANEYENTQKIFIATCVPKDEEMKKRVERHKKDRGEDWRTVETEILLPEAVSGKSDKGRIIVVDCLTLWISNLMLGQEEQDGMEKGVQRLMKSLKESVCPVILVTNEVGTGIVPENPMARSYRDAVGMVNQLVAKTANRVVWMVAGIPVVIKGKPLD